MMRTAVGALFMLAALLTLWRGWLKFPLGARMTRRDFPEGFYPLVALVFATGLWLVWPALRP